MCTASVLAIYYLLYHLVSRCFIYAHIKTNNEGHNLACLEVNHGWEGGRIYSQQNTKYLEKEETHAHIYLYRDIYGTYMHIYIVWDILYIHTYIFTYM